MFKNIKNNVSNVFKNILIFFKNISLIKVYVLISFVVIIIFLSIFDCFPYWLYPDKETLMFSFSTMAQTLGAIFTLIGTVIALIYTLSKRNYRNEVIIRVFKDIDTIILLSICLLTIMFSLVGFIFIRKFDSTFFNTFKISYFLITILICCFSLVQVIFFLLKISTFVDPLKLLEIQVDKINEDYFNSINKKLKIFYKDNSLNILDVLRGDVIILDAGDPFQTSLEICNDLIGEDSTVLSIKAIELLTGNFKKYIDKEYDNAYQYIVFPLLKQIEISSNQRNRIITKRFLELYGDLLVSCGENNCLLSYENGANLIIPMIEESIEKFKPDYLEYSSFLKSLNNCLMAGYRIQKANGHIYCSNVLNLIINKIEGNDWLAVNQYFTIIHIYLSNIVTKRNDYFKNILGLLKNIMFKSYDSKFYYIPPSMLGRDSIFLAEWIAIILRRIQDKGYFINEIKIILIDVFTRGRYPRNYKDDIEKGMLYEIDLIEFLFNL